MARVALLIMENNRLKYVDNLRTTQLGGFRGGVTFQQPIQVPVQLPLPIIRQSNPIITQVPIQQRIITGQPLTRVVQGETIRVSQTATAPIRINGGMYPTTVPVVPLLPGSVIRNDYPTTNTIYGGSTIRPAGITYGSATTTPAIPVIRNSVTTYGNTTTFGGPTIGGIYPSSTTNLPAPPVIRSSGTTYGNTTTIGGPTIGGIYPSSTTNLPAPPVIRSSGTTYGPTQIQGGTYTNTGQITSGLPVIRSSGTTYGTSTSPTVIRSSNTAGTTTYGGNTTTYGGNTTPYGGTTNTASGVPVIRSSSPSPYGASTTSGQVIRL